MTKNGIGPTLADAIAALPNSQRRSIERRAAELIAEEMSIRELRKSLALTQSQVARGLGKGQHEISRIEQRGDMLLSTLSRFVEALGGELELICRFKKHAPVRIIPPALVATQRRGSKPSTRPRSRRAA